MAKADIAALLALGAAFFIAIGDVIHQRSAHEVTDEPVSHLGLFTRLLRDRQWWLGSLVAAAGFALQAAALGLGSVLLVQALLVTSLLFALPINARLTHRRVTRWEWMWAALLAASVAVIVTVGNPTAGQSRASLETWIAVVACSGRPGAVRGGGAHLVRADQRGAAGGGVRRAVGAVRGADQGRGGPARREQWLASGRCCAHPSCTRGRWSRSPAPRGSSRRFGPAR